MTTEKFELEINTLKEFFELYCKNNHKNMKSYTKNLTYKNKEFKIELILCEECKEDIFYSFDRLLQCPHEIKPRCRKCPKPCYEKKQWKKTAKIMKYSGIQLGLKAIKSKFKKILK
ncbi:hypothetical protein CP960_10865 [Malaciobacter halophilus]|uniref:Nitrous oxide-stimulated promoter family protein n=1 Tax=Malaciobacter halophilus TaxID=197482 RepID=A0A2N1J0P5_9BACT|nr:nitrous oxide-stimulated promoter family protein [Malaciobacter halophilus]AXH11019.1 putative nitrous oxide-regulated protein [Malaciobacter halophilus]PKI80116.1 hypothetical protein CP960_10865 [Malaciobacter halophilus]